MDTKPFVFQDAPFKILHCGYYIVMSPFLRAEKILQTQSEYIRINPDAKPYSSALNVIIKIVSTRWNSTRLPWILV